MLRLALNGHRSHEPKHSFGVLVLFFADTLLLPADILLALKNILLTPENILLVVFDTLLAPENTLLPHTYILLVVVEWLRGSSADFVVRVPAPLKSADRRGDADYKVRVTAPVTALTG